MKRSEEIKELVVFSIMDGKEIGKVKGLLINPRQKAVEYLSIDIPDWYLGLNVIPFNMVEGIGEDAVMVEDENVIRKLNEEPTAVELIERGIHLINNKVLTKKGRVIGTVSEFYVNEDNGEIAGCEYVDENNNVKGIIPTNVALTFGKDALIVSNDVENHLLGSFEQYESGEENIPAAIKTIEPEKTGEFVNDTKEEATTEEEIVLNQQQIKPNEASEDQTGVANLFMQRQQEYLLGKVVNKDIIDSDGKIIIHKGDTITKETIDKATSAGKFNELMLNV